MKAIPVLLPLMVKEGLGMPLIGLLSGMPAASLLPHPLVTSQATIILSPSAALTEQTTLAYNALLLDFVDTLLSRFFFISFAGFSCGSFCNITVPQVCSSCLHVSNICDRCSRITCAKCPHVLPWVARLPNSKMLRNHETFLLGLAHDLPASML